MSGRWLWSARAALAIVAVVSVAGCGADTEAQHPRYSYQQAVTMTEQLLKDTGVQLQPRHELNPVPYGFGEAPCGESFAGDETGETMTERSVRLDKVRPEREHTQEILNQLKRYWQTNGFHIVYEDGTQDPTRTHWDVSVRNDVTGFKMKLTHADGVLSLSAQSPCVPEPPLT